MWRSNLSQILSHHTGRELKSMIPCRNTSFTFVFNNIPGNALALQRLGLCFYCRDPGSSPGGGAKIPKAMWHSQNRKTNKISLQCSDLLMLLQERKSILVSFSFFPPNYHSESDQVYLTHGGPELESSPEVLRRRKSTSNLGALGQKWKTLFVLHVTTEPGKATVTGEP